MSQLYLPASHTEADLVLAGQVAMAIDSAELYVAWTPEHGRVAPEVAAELREPAPRLPGVVALLLQAAREIWDALRTVEDRPALEPPRAAGDRPAQERPATGG